MHRYLCRLYVAAPTDGKKVESSSKHSRAAFFAVFFTPKAAREPVAAWGTITANAPSDVFSVIKPTFLRDDGPAALNSPKIEEWAEVSSADRGSISYVVCPLVELTNAGVVESMVVERLLKRFQA
jgi:hypothetical protein